MQQLVWLIFLQFYFLFYFFNIPCCCSRLHDYIPHGGSSVTRLIFCDDHLSKDPRYNTKLLKSLQAKKSISFFFSRKEFWRFLLTAAEDSTVVKVWCTVNWKCLQTIRYIIVLCIPLSTAVCIFVLFCPIFVIYFLS